MAEGTDTAREAPGRIDVVQGLANAGTPPASPGDK